MGAAASTPGDSGTGTPGSDPGIPGDDAGALSLNGVIEQQLLTLFRRTNSIHVETAHGDHELDRSTYGILCLLDDAGPQRLGAIAAAYRLDPSTVTRQAQAAVRLGLAEKSTDPADRRASLLALTEEGQDAVRRARAHRRMRLDEIMAAWTPEERNEFGRALTRFNDTLTRLPE
ncbi:MarR family winged helix-turn-helix transcriptional regulator [Nocardioides alkalitolerans]|uniref:MarR family winged helix-turn-helix transcriptional regulator n=1 Tax=Nocardioides alkalitolerans TaxID=281714 RepID=UPI000412F613|nr:MarR family winged helix-turn-helix transcriptional regulator [Nocardioides alkalitolerans]